MLQAIISFLAVGVTALFSVESGTINIPASGPAEILPYLANKEVFVTGAHKSDPFLNGTTTYMHLPQLSAQKRLWGKAFEYIVDTPSGNKDPRLAVSSLFDVLDSTSADLMLRPFEPCVTAREILGYKYASVLAMSHMDHAGALWSLPPLEQDDRFDRFIASIKDDGLTYRRVKFTQAHFLLCAYPSTVTRGETVSCWYIDERREPTQFEVPNFMEVKDVVFALFERPELAHWKKAYAELR